MNERRARERRALIRGLAACGLAAVARPRLARSNDLHLGAPAPTAILTTLDGEHISTADLRGRVVLLTFWATWCGPCRQELPLLSSYAAQHSRDGLSVLGFSLDDAQDLKKVRAVAQTLSFPVGLVSSSSLPGYGRIWHIPVNFAIDRDGRLVDNGWKDKEATWTAERLESIVTPLLRRSVG